jgi:AcrR family transcriptional regulator
MNSGSRPYRLGARAVGMEETSERILRAATEEFWEAPSPDIRLDAIALRAGVSVQTILRHFGGKQDLMARAVEWQSARVTATRDPAAVTDAASAVRQLVAHYEDVGDGVIRLLGEEGRAPSLVPILEQGRAFHRAWCATAFAKTLDVLPRAERRLRLAQLVALCDVYTWKLLRRDSGLSRSATERALLGMLQPLVKES